jgi:hypothetical protein
VFIQLRTQLHRLTHQTTERQRASTRPPHDTHSAKSHRDSGHVAAACAQRTAATQHRPRGSKATSRWPGPPSRHLLLNTRDQHKVVFGTASASRRQRTTWSTRPATVGSTGRPPAHALWRGKQASSIHHQQPQRGSLCSHTQRSDHRTHSSAMAAAIACTPTDSGAAE